MGLKQHKNISFHFSFGVLMTYLFCIMKNNGSNVRCTTAGEKSNKCCARNHPIFCVCLRGIAREYIFHSYQENSLSKGEILDKKIFIKSLANQGCVV